MARVFRQRYTKSTPDGRRVTKISRKWYVEYRDAQGIRRRVPGYTDKPATQQLAAELERRAAQEQSGLVDRFAEHRKRPLSEHITDWHKSLLHKGTSRKHADLVRGRALRVVEGCGFVFWSELSASKVQAYVAGLRNDGTSVQTCNFYLQAAKQFCRWMVQDGRAPQSPVAYLKGGNVRLDRRHDRRAFGDAELRNLLETTRNSATRYKMTGSERAFLYRLAAETGLRAGEIRNLMLRSFHLDGDPPTVTVEAAYSKHRREDVQPLPPRLAADLRTELADRSAASPVFTMPYPSGVARMLKADLQDTGIPYRDDSGRVLDFHAFRHTFITNLARGGVHPKQAQDLARHSDINLTMSRYSHTVLADRAAALSALPDLSGGDSDRLEHRATGTCDIAPRSLPPGLPKSLPTPAASKPSPVAPNCRDASVVATKQVAVSASGTRTCTHSIASPCADLHRRRRDSNPRDDYSPNGFQDRRLQPLGHSSIYVRPRCRSVSFPAPNGGGHFIHRGLYASDIFDRAPFQCHPTTLTSASTYTVSPSSPRPFPSPAVAPAEVGPAGWVVPPALPPSRRLQ